MSVPSGGPRSGAAGEASARQAKVHLVGGFLGSGKSTAIAGACKLLAGRGVTAGVITNDQGAYLVDTAFFRAASVPTTEVVGGCFCCNLGEYRKAVERLLREKNPPVVFAEAVGSCADIVATVIKPGELTGGAVGRIASYSVFVDARLARLWLSGTPLPFGSEITYLFEKQMEEAEVLVVNKTDLLPAELRDEVTGLIAARFPDKRVLGQCSLSAAEIEGWVAAIDSSPPPSERPSLEIDYDRYGAAEAALAWYDARLQLQPLGGRPAAADGTPAEASSWATADGFLGEFLAALRFSITTERRQIGHLKLEVLGAGGECKLSLTEADRSQPIPRVTLGEGPLSIVLNARVSGDPAGLKEIVRSALATAAQASGWRARVDRERAFSPSFPHPTERIG